MLDSAALLGPQVTTAAVAVWLFQKIKDSNWVPFISQETGALNKFLAGLISALTAAGLHFTYDQGAGVLTIAGLTLANLQHFAFAWIQQHVFQESLYNGYKLANRSQQLRVGDGNNQVAPGPMLPSQDTGTGGPARKS